jgi:hypothetical protein
VLCGIASTASWRAATQYICTTTCTIMEYHAAVEVWHQ